MAAIINPATPKTKSKMEPANSEKRQCIDAGGRWDEATQTCIMPETVKPKIIPKDPVVTDREGNQRIAEQSQAASAARRNELEIGVALDAGTSARQSLEAKEKYEREEAEVQRLIEEETPQKRELDPYTNKLEQIPIVGEFVNEAFNILTRNLPFAEKIGFPQDGTGKLNYQPQPEELKTAILTEIERREIEAGLTSSEKFGTFAESIKIGELEKYIPGIGEAEEPSKNVQNIVKSLRVLKTRVTDIESKIISGRLTQSQANERLALIENELQAGESRMRLLIQNSPELKVNSDGVNFIELKVLETRERIQDARISNVRGKTSDPTDLEVLKALQESINNEDFNIPGLE